MNDIPTAVREVLESVRRFEPIFVFRKPGAPPPAAPEAQAEALDALLDDL